MKEHTRVLVSGRNELGNWLIARGYGIELFIEDLSRRLMICPPPPTVNKFHRRHREKLRKRYNNLLR
jgi:hypothetical protein